MFTLKHKQYLRFIFRQYSAAQRGLVGDFFQQEQEVTFFLELYKTSGKPVFSLRLNIGQ